MEVPRQKWDEIVAECIDISERLEMLPKDVVYLWKAEILGLLYDIIYLKDIHLNQD